MQHTDSSPDYYKILGVRKDATQEEIKRAYKALAKQWHPDKNMQQKKSAEKKFKEISKAYGVLSDDVERRCYDRAMVDAELNRRREEQNRRDERVRRMAKEQEDYVRKQDARRRRGQRMRYGFHGNDDFSSASDFTADSNQAFRDFFADRERWRQTVPNLFEFENSFFSDMMKQMTDMMVGHLEAPFNSAGNVAMERDLQRMKRDADRLSKRQSRLDEKIQAFKATQQPSWFTDNRSMESDFNRFFA